MRTLILLAVLCCSYHLSMSRQGLTMQYQYHLADSVAEIYNGHSVQSLKLLADKLTKPFENNELKYRSIFSWVCHNIAVDYRLVTLNQHQRKKLKGQPQRLKEWNQEIAGKVFRNLLEERKTLCTGYAYLIHELCAFSGIESEIVNGFVRDVKHQQTAPVMPNHSWNAVKINGTWYMTDATWSSGIFDLRNKVFVPQFDESYFLVEPDLFFQDHIPIDWKTTDSIVTLDQMRILNGPVIYKGLIKHRLKLLKPLKRDTQLTSGESLTIVMEAPVDIKPEEFQLITRHRDLPVTLEKLPHGKWKMTWVPKKKGRYTIHLLLNKDYLASFDSEVGPL